MQDFARGRLAWCGRGRQQKIRRIGFLGLTYPPRTLDFWMHIVVACVTSGMSSQKLSQPLDAGPMRPPTRLAHDLIRKNVDLVVTCGSEGGLAAKHTINAAGRAVFRWLFCRSRHRHQFRLGRTSLACAFWQQVSDKRQKLNFPRIRTGVSLNKIVLWLLMVALTGSNALAQERPMERASYRVQLSEISVQSPRSRRTDTNYAAISVQVGDKTARTVTRRIGNVGRGTKAVNMSLSKVVLTSQTQLRITWSVVNYGGERHDVLMRAVGNATEALTNESGMTQLSEAVSDALAERKTSCDGPVFYATFEISGAELSGQLRSGKPLRITRRQQGMDAPSRCESRSDYLATVVIFKER